MSVLNLHIKQKLVLKIKIIKKSELGELGLILCNPYARIKSKL